MRKYAPLKGSQKSNKYLNIVQLNDFQVYKVPLSEAKKKINLPFFFFRLRSIQSPLNLFYLAGCSRSGGASVVHHLSEDLKKEELLLEIHRLRERIKSLETDNASMHTKLSKAQKDVSQRLAEIEMQINDNEQDGLHCFSPTELSQEDEEDEDSEINRESFI